MLNVDLKLHSAYADDTTFFLQDTISMKHMVNVFDFFSYFSGLNPNLKNLKFWLSES